MFPGHINTEPGRLTAALPLRNPRAHCPFPAVPRGESRPSDQEFLFEPAKPLVGQILKAIDGIRCRSKTLTKRDVAFRYHLSSAFLAGVPRGVADDDTTAAPQTAKGLLQGSLIVFRVVEGSIEYDCVELLALKRQMCSLRLKPREA